MIDYMVLGVIAALILFAWRVIRIQKQESTGCCHGCHECGKTYSAQKRQEEEK
ncbi:MAG: FeoB-associated Cys-rich membrane protein [Butyricicoccus sp.]